MGSEGRGLRSGGGAQQGVTEGQGRRLGQAAGCLQVRGRGAAGAGVGGGEDLAGSRDAHRKRRGRGLSLREGHGDWGCE